MLKKIFCLLAVTVILLTMLPADSYATECPHRYTLIGENACTEILKCDFCGQLSYPLKPTKSHIFPENTPCEEFPVCTICGLPDAYIIGHDYTTFFFGGFTYCRNCEECTFSWINMDWITFFSFIGGLVFFIFIVVMTIKCRNTD